MADFNVNVAGSQGGAQPVAPVRQQPTDMGLNLFAQVGTVLAKAGGEYAENQRKLKTQELVDSNVSEFAQAQLRIADAVESGDLSSQEGRMRMRANYTRGIADNPGLVNDYAKVHKEIISTSGLGKVVAEGTPEEQNSLAAQKDAYAAGWIKPSMSPSERDNATQDHLKFLRAQEDLKAAQAQVNYDTSKINQQSAGVGLQSARVNLQSAKIGLAEKQQTLNSQQAIGAVADSYHKKFAGDMDEIRVRLDKKEITPEQAVQLADQQWAGITDVTNKIGAHAGSEYLNNVTSPMKMVYDNTKKYLTGQTTKELLDNHNAIAISLQQQNILGDPQTAKIVATSNLFKNADLTLMPSVNRAVVKIIGNGSTPETKPNDPMPHGEADKKDSKTYTDLVKSNMSGSVNGTLQNKDMTDPEIETHVNDILKGVNAYSLSTTNPADYNNVVDFLASPEFGKYATNKGGLDSELTGTAGQVLQSNYEKEVIPLIQKAWEDSKTGNTSGPMSARAFVGMNVGDSNTSDVIKPTFSGSGVSFQVAPGITDPRTRAKAADLNKQVAPVLNRLIRMNAHLEGNQDYKSVYEKNYSSIFNPPTEQETK